ncbi:MAG: MATE family efflux transporter [Ruminococcus sp.]|nr:MATE family efflux transporter [Ruminococcus sp.]
MSEEKNLRLWSLAWPIFIETALFMLLGFVDVFILSKYDDLAASSVGAANQAVSIATIVFTVVSSASAVLISQYLGAKKKESASRIAALSIVLHLLTGLVISAVFVLFNAPILRFIGAEGKILEFGAQYLSIVGGFIFLQALMTAMSVIIRNHGMTRVSMYVTVGMNLLNTALDTVLVLGLFGLPRMGVTGVAIATSFSRIAGTIILAVVLFRKIEKISIFRLLKPFPWADLGAIIKIGVPAALETFLYNLSQLVITSMVLNCLTDNELIAKTYVQNITMFFYIFAVSIGQASQIMVGHLVGAGKTEEAYRQGLVSHRRALLISLIVSFLGVIFRSQLLGIYTDDAAVIALGAGIFVINFFLEFGRTTNLVMIACLRGAGDVYFPTACAIFSMWVISVGGSFLFAVAFGWGIYGLWIALAADEVFRGILMLLRWRSGKWKTKRVVKEV